MCKSSTKTSTLHNRTCVPAYLIHIPMYYIIRVLMTKTTQNRAYEPIWVMCNVAQSSSAQGCTRMLGHRQNAQPTMPKLSRAIAFPVFQPIFQYFPIPNGSMTCICKPPPGMLFNMFEYQLDYCSHCLLNLWSLLTSNSDFCNLIPIYREYL